MTGLEKKCLGLLCVGVLLALIFQNCSSPNEVPVEYLKSRAVASSDGIANLYQFMDAHLDEPVVNDKVTIIFRAGKQIEYHEKNARWKDAHGKVSYHDVFCSYNIKLVHGTDTKVAFLNSKNLSLSTEESDGICQLIANAASSFTYQVGKYESFSLSFVWPEGSGSGMSFNFF